MGGIPPPPGSVPFSGPPQAAAAATGSAPPQAAAPAKAKAAPPVVAQPINPAALVNTRSALNPPKNIQAVATPLTSAQQMAVNLQNQAALNTANSLARKQKAAAKGVAYVSPRSAKKAAADAAAAYAALSDMQKSLLGAMALINAANVGSGSDSDTDSNSGWAP
jgi:hypothetical protein